MFECSRCGYKTNIKCNLKNHLKRKNICDANFSDIDRNELLLRLYPNMVPKINKKLIKINKCNPNVIQTSSKCNPDVIQKSSGENLLIYNCRYCNKAFRYRQGRYKHEKNRCATKLDYIQEQNNEKLIETVKELKEQVGLLTKQNTMLSSNHNSHNSNHSNNNSHNTNNHNTNSFNTVNVNLNTIGNENIEYLKTFLLENINSIIQCKTDFFIEYVKQKHFHPEHIENHNIVSFNQRSNSMYGYTKLEKTLERRLKNSMSLLLYRNIIQDVNGFLDNQIQCETTKRKKRLILNRASNSMINQEDAINDYEHKDNVNGHVTTQCKKNIRKVGKHIKEIENTIYNQSKHVYGDLTQYYTKHNNLDDNKDVDDRTD